MADISEEKKVERFNLLTTVFTPTSPIIDKELFIGRQHQVNRIISTIITPGEHAILYGERGIGKSSLANVIPAFLTEKTQFKTSGGQVTRVTCTKDDTFKTLWERTLKQISFTQEIINDQIGFLQEKKTTSQSISLNQCVDFSSDVTPGVITDLLARIKDFRFLFILTSLIL